MTVFNKGKERSVPMRGDLRRELLAYAKDKKIESGTLFPSEKKNDGSMISERTVERRILKICGMCRGIDLAKAHRIHSDICFLYNFKSRWQLNRAC